MYTAPRTTLLLVALIALPSVASAERVVVGSIRGDQGDAIRARVETTLRERVEVVPWAEFRAAYRGLDAEAIRSACEAVDARAIVLGDVEGRGRLNLMALSCETGEIAAESQVALRRGLPRPDSLYTAVAAMFFEQGAQSLLNWATRSPEERAGAAPPARSERRPPAPTPVAAAPRVAAEPPVAEAPPEEPEGDTRVTSRGESTAIASLLGSNVEVRRVSAHSTADEESETALAADVDAGPPALAFLELGVGATFASRTLDVVDRAGQSLGYSGGGYTELGGQATLFPLAVATRARWARVLGLSASFAKGVAVQATGPGLNIDTIDGGFGVLGRFAIEGSLPLEIRPQVGWGFRGFAIDWNPDVATFNYRYWRVGLDVRAALMRRPSYVEGTVGALSLGLTGGYRIVTDVGEAAAAYGADASSSGWDVGGYASVLLGKSIEITAGGELVRFSSTFAGAGSLERLAESSEDAFPRGFIRAGLVLR